MKKRIIGVFPVVALAVFLSGSAATAQEAKGPSWFNKFSLEGGITMVTQTSMGNNPDGSNDSTDFSYSGDVVLTGSLDDTQQLVFVFEAGDGHALNDDIEGNRANPNYDAYGTNTGGYTGTGLSQAYYQKTIGGDIMTFAVGQMDVHSLTDGNQFAGDETEQFMNNLFVRSTGVVFHELPNYYAPTLYLETKPVPFFSFIFTFASPNGHDITNDNHIMVELALHTQIGEGEGSYRFGYELSKGGFTKVGTSTTTTDPATGETVVTPGDSVTNSGLYISLDQGFGSMFGVFVRYAQQDNTVEQNEIISAISGGVSINNLLGNEGNSIGVGYGLLEVNTDVVKQYVEGMDILEVYVRFGVSESVRVTLDFQMLNDLERGSNRTVSIAGLRIQAGL